MPEEHFWDILPINRIQGTVHRQNITISPKEHERCKTRCHHFTIILRHEMLLVMAEAGMNFHFFTLGAAYHQLKCPPSLPHTNPHPLPTGNSQGRVKIPLGLKIRCSTKVRYKVGERTKGLRWLVHLEFPGALTILHL